MVVVVATALAGPAAAATLRSPGATLAVAASPAGAAAVTGRGIEIYDRDGYAVRTLARPALERSAGARRSTEDDTAATGLFAVGEDYAPVDGDPVGDGEASSEGADAGASGGRGRAPPPGSEGAPWDAVAIAAGAAAFLGGRGGLLRVDLADGTTVRVLAPQGAAGVRAAAASPDGATVAVVDGAWLLRSRDGGLAFSTVAPVVGTPRALAVDRGGGVLLVDASGVRRAGASLTALDPVIAGAGDGDVSGEVTDLTTCGDMTLGLDASARTLIALPARPGAPAEVIGEAPPGTRRIACDPDGGLLAAWGAELWTSLDRGRSWSLRLDIPAAPITSVAVATAAGRAAIWVATLAGLWTLPAAAAPPRPMLVPILNPTIELPRIAAAGRAVGMANAPLAWSWWHTFLPRIEIALSWARRGARHEVRGLALATFRIDGPWLGAARLFPVRQARARAAAAALAARTALAAAGANAALDPLDRDGDRQEREALVRVLEDMP
jgi:hypothetical protein